MRTRYAVTTFLRLLQAVGKMSTVSSFEGDVRKPKGAVLFTGPDGIGNHMTTVEEQRFVGHGSTSPESSSDTQYLYRSAPTCPHPPPKAARVGEVGWGVPSLSDQSLLKSGHQIKLKEFRQAVEDRHTHLYQNPYYPAPSPPTDTHTNSHASVLRSGESGEGCVQREDKSTQSTETLDSQQQASS